MLTSLAFIFLVGLSLAAICQTLKLPRNYRYADHRYFTGTLCAERIGSVDSVHLIGAAADRVDHYPAESGTFPKSCRSEESGTSCHHDGLHSCNFRILAYFLLAPYFLGITRLEAAVMGAVMGAVSPAVVVPRMVQLMDEKYGTAKSIPQMILAGASCDDIYVIVLFSTFSTMAQGGSAHLKDFVNIPVSIILGIALGSMAGYLLSLFFETAYAHSHMVRNSMKVIVVMGVAFLLMSIETWLKPVVSVSGLLAVVSMACVLKLKCTASVSARLSQKFGSCGWLLKSCFSYLWVHP